MRHDREFHRNQPRLRDRRAASGPRRTRARLTNLAAVAIFGLCIGIVIGRGIDWTDRERLERLILSMTTDDPSPSPARIAQR
ncbi:hypothetical protein [Sphingomonas alpina]|uniref:hypothetical protein n=1 Tax=Sphingomonas alpina TaxID=653931 RepID=UPI0021BB73D9|nr:hypothetical protein [Sphingomonas alpina]